MVKVIQNKKNIYRFLILVGLLFPVSNAFADGNTTDFSITVNPSVSLSVSSASVNFEITPTMAGAYNSANFTVTSATNNVYGYTLTMSTNNVNLTSNTVNPNTGTNPTIPTLTETQDGITAAQFEASTDFNVLNHYGVAIGANNYNAMKANSIIKRTAENNATADSTTVNLASKLDLLTVPGTYSTTLNFQIVANPLPGTFEDAFLGAGKTKDSINGQQYYAMQDMTSAICSNVTVGNEIEVYDSRDNTIYHIGKMADNRCWLLDNLAINLVDTSLADLKGKTNADDITLEYLKGVRTRNPSTDPNGNFATSGVINKVGDDLRYIVPMAELANKDIISPYDSLGIANSWKEGGLYNYCAASAGGYCYGDGNYSVGPGATGDATTDICPSNWRMPTSGENGEYTELAVAAGMELTYDEDDKRYYIAGEPGYSNYRNLLRLPFSDYYEPAMSYGGEGYEGYYWSSTYETAENMGMLSVWGESSAWIRPQSSDPRDFINAVRCIAK